MSMSARLHRLIEPMIPDQIARRAKQLFGQRIYDTMKRRLLGIARGGDRLGPLRRVTRIHNDDGWTRGEPIGRFYTNRRFLPAHASDVRGHVLEISESVYTRWFGKDRVTKSDVLHLTGCPEATIVADLTKADNIQSETFDCIIITFTLQFIYDIKAAIQTLHRILKPGGVVLATFDATSRISRADMDLYGEYWRVTTASAQKLFEEHFPPDSVTVTAYGNVLSAVARLHGFVAEDFFEDELDHHDPDIELIIGVRTVKSATST